MLRGLVFEARWLLRSVRMRWCKLLCGLAGHRPSVEHYGGSFTCGSTSLLDGTVVSRFHRRKKTTTRSCPRCGMVENRFVEVLEDEREDLWNT